MPKIKLVQSFSINSCILLNSYKEKKEKQQRKGSQRKGEKVDLRVGRNPNRMQSISNNI